MVLTISRGLFRIWVLASALWILAIAAMTSSAFHRVEYQRYFLFDEMNRSVKEIDWTTRWQKSEKDGLTRRISFGDDDRLQLVVFISVEDHQLKSVADEAHPMMLKAINEKHWERVRKEVAEGATAAVLVPLAVLLFGLAVRWALRGFWMPKQPGI